MSDDLIWGGTLSCPSTWRDDGMPCVPLPLSKASTLTDELDAAPTPWHRLVDMVS